jgi:mannose/fructose-specific phosphotransferase system component IIA
VLTTVERGKLTATMQDGKLVLTDEKGGTSTVTIASVIQSNGVIHESISGNISWVSKSPMFAPAYMGRKDGEKPLQRFANEGAKTAAERGILVTHEAKALEEIV